MRPLYESHRHKAKAAYGSRNHNRKYQNWKQWACIHRKHWASHRSIGHHHRKYRASHRKYRASHRKCQASHRVPTLRAVKEGCKVIRCELKSSLHKTAGCNEWPFVLCCLNIFSPDRTRKLHENYINPLHFWGCMIPGAQLSNCSYSNWEEKWGKLHGKKSNSFNVTARRFADVSAMD